MKTMESAAGNLPALKRAIAESEFDAVIAASPENVTYIGDVFISTQVDIRDRLALVVWDGSADPIFVLCQVEEGYVRQESWIQDIRTYKEFVTSPVEVLAEVLREKGLEAARIGLESDYLAGRYQAALERLLPKLSIGACEDLFAAVRMLKTPCEREIMTAAFRGTEKALMETFQGAKPGDTERDMCFRLSDGILRSGADTVAFTHINAGPNTGFPHMDPSDYQVKPGDILKADTGGYYSRYYSNVGRTAKLGPLSDADRDWWAKLRDIHHQIIDMLRPGNTGRELFEAATRLHAKHDIPFPYAHNGHGIGLFIHEPPLISPHETAPYQPGMMSTVETRVRWVGKVGYHMEDLVEITDGAPIVRSDYFDNEEILVV
ncbi:MAG: Xaa-Pro peptidase family protein [Alphaproteobacteria bacterium]|nr:Xaa-Pro peptidase family protein [Alphaproteobacteria bacterium]